MEVFEWSSLTLRLCLKPGLLWLHARLLLFWFCFPCDEGRLLVKSELWSLWCYTSAVTWIAFNDLTICKLRALMELVDVVHVTTSILGHDVSCWDGILPAFVDDEFESLANTNLQFLTYEGSISLVTPDSLAPSSFWLRLWELAKHLDAFDLIDTHLCCLKSECRFDNSLFLSLLLQNVRSECSLNLGRLLKDHLTELACVRSFHADVHL